MRQNFETVFKNVAISEGGYGNDVFDTGGATNLGITLAVWQEWNHDESLTAEDVKKITREQAAEVFRKRYWDLCKADDLPAGLDYCVADFSFNSGVGRAVRALQTQLGDLYKGIPDGIAGPLTVSACAKIADLPAFINAYQDNRLAAIKTFKAYWRFGNGWTTRVSEVRMASLKLAQSAVSYAALAGIPAAAAAAEVNVPTPVVATIALTPMPKPTQDDSIRVQSTSKTNAQLSTIGMFGATATETAQTLAPHVGTLSIVKYVFVALTLVSVAVTLYLTVRKMNVEG